MARVPVTLEVGVRTFFCGPESFTPDLAPAVGEAPGIRGYFVAAGHELRRRPLGRRARPGASRTGSSTGGPTSTSPASTSPGSAPGSSTRAYRGDAHHRDPRHRVRRAHARASSCAPRATRAAARPVHDRLVAQGRLAARGLRLGGRRLVRRPRRRPPRPSRRWGHAPWFEQWEAEHRAVREGVGLMDMSFMAKFARARAPTPARCSTASRAGAVNGDAGRDHLHPVARRRRPASRPTSPSPSWPTTTSSWSPPTPRTGTRSAWLRAGTSGTPR